MLEQLKSEEQILADAELDRILDSAFASIKRTAEIAGQEFQLRTDCTESEKYVFIIGYVEAASKNISNI